MSYLDHYSLDRSPKKHICPGCGKKSFVAYLKTESKEIVDETKYGRCDRENNCGYHEKPEIEQKEGTKKTKILRPKKEDIERLREAQSPLHRFLVGKGIPSSFLYSIGVYECNGLTAYGFFNQAAEMVNVKYFKYKDDGHRDKGFESYSLKQPDQVEGQQQEKYELCLFLEAELDPTKEKIACVVESEKSAVICKFYYPEFDWVSCGSANGLSDGSEDTSDKITPLLGRTVYWICDADKAGRGKIKDGKWTWNSSIRNGIKHLKNKFHVVDLFPNREDGWDLGDELLEGRKPEIKPTWSAWAEDERMKIYMPPNKITDETEEVKGETCHVKELSDIFAWMRGHVCAWYGWPNFGKGTFTDFMLALKVKHAGLKILINKQEDMTSAKQGGKRIISADTIYDNFIWTITGKCTSEFYGKNNNIEFMSIEELNYWRDWIKKYIFVIYPKDRSFKKMIDNYRFYFEVFGIDIFMHDPWNTVSLPPASRGDERLIGPFIELKEFALETHTMQHIVNHPKVDDDVYVKAGPFKGAYKVVKSNMQLGGSAFGIKMDAEYSVHRQNAHNFPNDPWTEFWNLKQREKARVGVEKGKYSDIIFDPHRRQYYFNGNNPMDGSTRVFTQEPYVSPFTPKKEPKKKNGKSFDAHIKEDWGDQPPPHTDDNAPIFK